MKEEIERLQNRERAAIAERDAADAVAAKWQSIAQRLWMLLDDIDTQDDASKSNDAHFRKFAYRIQQRRHAIITGDALELPRTIHPAQAAGTEPDYQEAAGKCLKYAGTFPPNIARGLIGAVIEECCRHAPASLATATGDKERLDWLDSIPGNYSVGRCLHAPENPDPMPFAFTYGLGSRAKTIPFRGSVRLAIDAAMAGKTEIVDPFPPLPEHMRDAPFADVCEHGTPKGYYCAKCDSARTHRDGGEGSQ